MPQAATIYDEIPYNDNAFKYTHPAFLGAVGALYGICPANPEHCRVLELGTAAGANLIPMAIDLPGSEFVGIDLSTRQIDQGRRTIAALGLTNVGLHAGSILEVNDDWGRFDYIICHGVYSWVPEEVRQAIFRVCKSNLAAGGIAYISYNTYPGWHLRGLIRDMMMYHVNGVDARERVGRGRAVLSLLAQAATGRDPVFADLLRRETDKVNQGAETYIFHEYLGEVNAPVYFHQFAERVGANGLRYLAEAEPNSAVQGLSPDVLRTLGQMSGSLIEMEQNLDFIINQHFRRSLLCHEHVELQRPPRSEALTGLYLRGLAQPVASSAAAPGSESFQARDGGVVNTFDPILRAALHSLSAAAPAALGFAALWDQVRTRLPSLDASKQSHLADAMLFCYLTRLVDLTTRPPALTVEIDDHPRVSPLARMQAAAGQPVCNLFHQQVTLEPFVMAVLQHLDGTRGKQALAEALRGPRSGGAGISQSAGAPNLDASLEVIARCGLLMAGRHR